MARIDDDRLAAAYASHRRVHPGVLGELIETGAVAAASRILEVGCGTGDYLGEIAASTGCEAHGIDPSPVMPAHATPSGPVRPDAGRAEHLPFPPATFDLVDSVDVIHHVAGRAAHIQEAHRALKPGGGLCTVTGSEWMIRNRVPLSAHFPETVDVELQRYPGVASLRQESSQEFRHRLTDSRPYRDRAFSSLHLIPDEASHRGLERLEHDLRRGPIDCNSFYVLLWGRRT